MLHGFFFFSPNPSHSATDSLSDLVKMFLASLPSLGGPKIVSPGARPRSRRPCSTLNFALHDF